VGLSSGLRIFRELELEDSEFYVSRGKPQHPVEAHQWEDVRSFEGDIIESFITLFSFGITRDNLFRNPLELFEGETNTALVVKPS
jgi:hypothetical protein